MRRRGALPALAVALLIVLSGCATIPTSGPVETAPAQPAQGDPGFGFQPAPPAEGASPENIVRGFIQASSAGGDLAVAKQYLTSGFARSWRHDEVLVHTASWTTTKTATDRIRLSIPLAAQVDEEGVYTPKDTGETRDFELVQVRGQWRISNGPRELVLAQSAFQRVYSAAYLQFFDPGWKRFVPDLRWFPRESNRVAETVGALLAGQAPVLRDVTRNAFPDSVALAAPVRAGAGTISIDLKSSNGRPDEQSTDRMQQQLLASLAGIGAAVELTVDGRTAPEAPELQTEQISVTDPVGVVGGRFGVITASGAVREDRVLGPRIVALKPAAVTFSARQDQAAVLSGDGTISIVRADAASRPIDQREDLLPPTLDQNGYTWSIPGDQPDGLRVTDRAGRDVPISVSLSGTEVLAIEVSPDGTRLLVLLDATSGPEAYVYGIERDGEGRPTGLTSVRYPVSIGSDVTQAIDATWVDLSSVAVLVSAGAAAQNVVVQQLGGVSEVLGLLYGAREIIGATTKDDLRARQSTGAVVHPAQLSGWTQEFGASVKVDVLAVQR